jgi:drug/metabolite transporter (DMT)-like permease
MRGASRARSGCSRWKKRSLKHADTARLVALAAIWGASYLFNRIAAPAVGPVLTAELRTLIGGVALSAYFGFTGFDPQWRRHGARYLVMGILNTGLPFLLWAYAALSLTAGLMAVLNATSPMWGVLWSAVLIRERIKLRAILGLGIGIVGVALVTGPEASGAFLPVAAALGAAFCYGLAGAYMKRWAADVPSRGMAVGTQLAAGMLLVPLLAVWPPYAAPTPLVAAAILALGLVCGAVAYVLYFRLIADIGATGALTVTYLIPVFGVLWGAVFLGETLTLRMLGGAVLVVLGTVFVLRN